MRVVTVISAIFFLACTPNDTPPGGTVDGIVIPDPAAHTWTNVVDNPYFPLPPGAKWTYEATTADGVEHDEFVVTSDSKTVNGVDVVVVRDTVWVDGVLVEATDDWFVQDEAGNVWYFGEETCEYTNDECVDTVGSWEYGIDGAQPGILMPATPAVDGQPYFQEYYVGEAEDVGEVVEVGISVSVPAGDYTDCIKTHDTSHLDATLDEHKVYCPGVGNVLTEEPTGNVELLSVTM